MKFILPILLLSINCYSQTYTMRYDLSMPEQTVVLPMALEEVSGLTYSVSLGRLLAVQDEIGSVFVIEPDTGKVENIIPFWKAGDYEGIEVVGDAIYVLKSSGTLYEIKQFQTDEQEVTKYNDFLDSSFDTEGLGYDMQNNRLLIACKAAGSTQFEKAWRHIYAFDLTTKALQTTPVISIPKQAVIDFLNLSPNLEKWDKLVAFFSPDDSAYAFGPSAIAIHPITGEIYLLSANGRLLFVLDQEGKLLHLEKLSKKIHRQPEGICFLPNGDLFIANEGKDSMPKLYRFKRL